MTEVVPHRTLTIVRARYDGNYDKTNLPPELILTNYFTIEHGKITSLITLRTKTAPSEQHTPNTP